MVYIIICLQTAFIVLLIRFAVRNRTTDFDIDEFENTILIEIEQEKSMLRFGEITKDEYEKWQKDLKKRIRKKRREIK